MQDIDVEIDQDEETEQEPERKLHARKNLPEVITYKKPDNYMSNATVTAPSTFVKPREKLYNTLFEFIFASENPNYIMGTVWGPDMSKLPLKLLRTEEASYLNSYGLDLFDNLRETEWKSMCQGILNNHPDV